MTATLLDGKALREIIFADLRVRTAALTAIGHTPGIATIIVGADPGSAAYVRGKHQDSAAIGVNSIRYDLPADLSQEALLEVIAELNADPRCDGYILQLPLPRHLEAGPVLEAIDPEKDADGLHPISLGRLVLGEPGPLPCTPAGIVALLRHYRVTIDGAHAVIIGRGVTVGRPLGLLLTRRSENATVTLCHTGTKNVAAEIARADIVISAAGVPGLVTADMVKPGAAVLDVGITRTAGGLVGDVHPDVARVAAFFAPMPGGVGPMTRAMLQTNVVIAAEKRYLPKAMASTW